MAQFEIQTPDGKSYQVEAPDMQTATQSLSAYNGTSTPDKDTSYYGAIKYGLAQGVHGIGNTLSKFDTTAPIGKAIESFSQPFIDPNYSSAETTFQVGSPSTWKDAPRALVEGIGNNLGAMGAGLAGGFATGGPIGAALGGAAGGMLSHYGDALDQRMANQPSGAQPSGMDQAAAALSSGAQGALSATGFGKGIGTLTGGLGTVAQGVGANVLKTLPGAIAKSAGIDAITNAGNDTIDQLGRKLGTNNQNLIDPTEVANQAALGGVGGAITRGLKSTADINQAIRLRSFDDTPTETNNLITRLNQSGADPKTPTGAYAAMKDAQTSLSIDIDAAKNNAKPFLKSLPADESKVVQMNEARLNDGNQLTPTQMNQLTSVLSASPDGKALLSGYVEQNQYNKLASLGVMDDKNKTFGGGFQNSTLFKKASPTSDANLHAMFQLEALGHVAKMLGASGLAGLGAIPAALGTAVRTVGRGVDAFSGEADPVNQLITRLGGQNAPGAPQATSAPFPPPVARMPPSAPPGAPVMASTLGSNVIPFPGRFNPPPGAIPSPPPGAVPSPSSVQPSLSAPLPGEAPPLTVHMNDTGNAPPVQSPVQAPSSPFDIESAIADAIKNARPIDGTTSEQPKSTAEKPQPEDKTQTAAQTGDFHTYQGIDYPVPSNVKNRTAYVRSLENKQNLIDGTFNDAINNAPNTDVAHALEDGWYDAKVSRNQDDAQGVINKIVRATPAEHRSWVRHQFTDDFYKIWRKKTKNDA